MRVKGCPDKSGRLDFVDRRGTLELRLQELGSQLDWEYSAKDEAEVLLHLAHR